MDIVSVAACLIEVALTVVPNRAVWMPFSSTSCCRHRCMNRRPSKSRPSVAGAGKQAIIHTGDGGDTAARLIARAAFSGRITLDDEWYMGPGGKNSSPLVGRALTTINMRSREFML